MKQKLLMLRQGDVLIERIDEIPAGAQPAERENGRVILAHGEVTGHAHAIKAPRVRKLTDGPASYLEVKQAVALLEHEEHSTIRIGRGVYRVTRQREYAPDAIRNVAD